MKKRLVTITLVVAIVVMAAAGTAMAYNGNGAADRTAQRFDTNPADYETVEAFQAALLNEKIAIVESKVEDGVITQEEANVIIEQLKANISGCTMDGTHPNRPEEGYGIFGRGNGDGTKAMDGSGYRGGNSEKGAGNGTCTNDGEPLKDGSGSDSAHGYMGGRNK